MVAQLPVAFNNSVLATPASQSGSGLQGLQARLTQAQPADSSHMPSDTTQLSDADRLAKEEEEAHKHLKSFYALGTVLDTTVRSLGNLGVTWGLIQGLMGHKLTGWTAVGAGAGSALKVADAAFMTKMAAVNRNEAAAVENSFDMVQGMGVLLTSLGLGRIPAFVSVAAVVGKGAYTMYRASQAQKVKDEAKKEDEARRAAEKAAKDSAEQSKPAVSQPTVAALASPSAVSGAASRSLAAPLLSESLMGTAFAAMRPISMQADGSF